MMVSRTAENKDAPTPSLLCHEIRSKRKCALYVEVCVWTSTVCLPKYTRKQHQVVQFINHAATHCGPAAGRTSNEPVCGEYMYKLPSKGRHCANVAMEMSSCDMEMFRRDRPRFMVRAPGRVVLSSGQSCRWAPSCFH